MGRIELEIYTPGYVPNGREVAVIETARGIVRAELFGRETPVTVGNFIELAAKGFYDNLNCFKNPAIHRLYIDTFQCMNILSVLHRRLSM